MGNQHILQLCFASRMEQFLALASILLCILNAVPGVDYRCVWDEDTCRDGCDEKAMAEQCSKFAEMVACEMAERCDWVEVDRYQGRTHSAQTATLADTAKRAAINAMLTVSGTQIILMAIGLIFLIFIIRELSRRHRQQSNERKNSRKSDSEYGSTETV